MMMMAEKRKPSFALWVLAGVPFLLLLFASDVRCAPLGVIELEGYSQENSGNMGGGMMDTLQRAFRLRYGKDAVSC